MGVYLALAGGSLCPSTGRELLIPVQYGPILHNRIETVVQGPASGRVGSDGPKRDILKSSSVLLVEAAFERLLLEFVVLGSLRNAHP
jgi:hypothetical protein